MIPDEPEETETSQTQNEENPLFVDFIKAILLANARQEEEESVGETGEKQTYVCVEAQGAGGTTRIGPYEEWEAVEVLDCLQKQFNTQDARVLRAGNNLIPVKHVTRIYLDEVEEGDESW